jgi:Cysteine-rich secretory protein family
MPRSICFFFLAAILLPFRLRAQQQLNNDERQLFDSVNRERAAQSLAPLRWDETLAKAARLHARRMAFYNIVEHQLSGEPDLEARLIEAGARFGFIAENIGVGPNPQVIHDGWMHSPGHRDNILNQRVTSVGIAAVRNNAGLFAVEDFTLAVDALSLEEQEKKVEASLTEGGYHVGDLRDEARKACETNQLVMGMQATSMVRYETADLSKLPEGVEKRLRSKAARNVAVGACRVGGGPGFAHFRIAILVF